MGADGCGPVDGDGAVVTGAVSAGGWWDEEVSPVWRRQEATPALRMVKWLQAWGVRFWLDEQCSLYIYVQDREARFGEREELIADGDRLRAVKFATGKDVEVLRGSADPHAVAEVQTTMLAANPLDPDGISGQGFRWVCRCGERGGWAGSMVGALTLHGEHRQIVMERAVE